MSPYDAQEAQESEGFGGGPSDLPLLPLYPDHVVRHVWDREVKVICIYSVKQCVIIFNVFDDGLFFFRTMVL